MELPIFLIIVFLGVGYLARRQVGPRTQRERDASEAGRPIVAGVGAGLAQRGAVVTAVSPRALSR